MSFGCAGRRAVVSADRLFELVRMDRAIRFP
jgi:hypothetical protein